MELQESYKLELAGRTPYYLICASFLVYFLSRSHNSIAVVQNLCKHLCQNMFGWTHDGCYRNLQDPCSRSFPERKAKVSWTVVGKNSTSLDLTCSLGLLWWVSGQGGESQLVEVLWDVGYQTFIHVRYDEAEKWNGFCWKLKWIPDFLVLMTKYSY